MPRRKLLDKPTPKMKDQAIRTLAEIIADPEAPFHARTTAARTLVGPPGKEDEAPEDQAPPVITWLPAQNRNPELEQLGFHGDNPQQSIVLYDSKTQAGMDDLARWQAEHAARVAAFNGTPLSIAQKRSAKLLTAPL
jgi:hypothetical protein